MHYKYNINDIITTKTGKIQIIKQILVKNGKKQCKGYKYRCLIDNYIGETNEYNLQKGVGCSVCYGRTVIQGINDMCTTNPELAKLLANPEDGYKYTQNSGKSVDWKCPQCGNIIKNKKNK